MSLNPGFSDEERAALKKKWLRKRRLKKARALAILSSMAIIAVAAVVFIAFEAVKLIGGKNYEKSSNNSGNTQKLSLIENGDPYYDALASSSKADLPAMEGVLANASDAQLPKEEEVIADKGLVILDAGHGGYDGGAVCDLANEKDINLSITLLTKEKLEKLGYEVYLTRSTDDFVGLNKRAELANGKTEALCMVSIHQNSIDDHPEVAGVEAWTYERKGCIEFAEILARNVSDSCGAKNRGQYYRSNLVVTSKVSIPSVIIECGYLTSPTESALLITEEYQLMISTGICNAVEEFIQSYYK